MNVTRAEMRQHLLDVRTDQKTRAHIFLKAKRAAALALPEGTARMAALAEVDRLAKDPAAGASDRREQKKLKLRPRS